MCSLNPAAFMMVFAWSNVTLGSILLSMAFQPHIVDPFFQGFCLSFAEWPTGKNPNLGRSTIRVDLGMDDAVHPVLGKWRQRDLTNAEVGQFLWRVAQTDKNALWTIEAVPTSGQGARPDGNAGSEVGRQQETWKASTLPQRQREGVARMTRPICITCRILITCKLGI